MSVLGGNPLLIAGDDVYQISRSVRLRSSASAYFSRTQVNAATSGQKYTISFWVKRGSLGVAQFIWGTPTNYEFARFDSGDTLTISNPSGTPYWTTTQVFRDPSAWYHIVMAFDTTQATASNRLRLYVNGVEVTSWSSSATITQNSTAVRWGVNGQTSYIGQSNSAGYADLHLTEFNSIDGQQLTPSSFGESDAITGVWKPKKYAGTYGTNGFYLNFSDNSAATAAAIGKDSSGNGNNWTPNNISVTAGTTYDSMLDVPTPYADGGNGRGNYAVLNPLANGGGTLSGGNLNMTSGSGWQTRLSTIAVNSGKWYVEMTPTSGSSTQGIVFGISNFITAVSTYLGAASTSYGYYGADGRLYYNGTNTAGWGATVADNDVVGIALDMDAGTLKLYKNNTQQGSTITGLSGLFYIGVSCYGSATVSANFGQRPFAYTPPTGFKALNTQNLPDATIKKGNAYFDVLTWTGDGTSPKSRTGYGFQPDLVWTKGRSATHDHALFDAVRGTGAKVLSSNSTSAENDYGLSVVSFDSNGFTTQTGSLNHSYANTNGSTYVGWAWKESASAGFDIVTWSGDGASSRNISHSLGVAPSMIIARDRNAVSNWSVYHKNANATPQNGRLQLNTTDAFSVGSGFWNNTAPTSSVFTVGSGLNTSGYNQLAYLFAEVDGYSKFGSYTGNGSADGPFLYCGFRPKFIMAKRTDTTGIWFIYDGIRNPFNLVDLYLQPSSSAAETTYGNAYDFVSSGVKIRNTASDYNASGGTYIYAAFAENPFKNSLAR